MPAVSRRVTLSAAQGFVDSGYTLAPTANPLLAAVTRALGPTLARSSVVEAAFGNNGQYYAINCSGVIALPDISLSFGGRRFVIDKRDTFIPAGGGLCAMSWCASAQLLKVCVR